MPEEFIDLVGHLFAGSVTIALALIGLGLVAIPAIWIWEFVVHMLLG